MVVLESFHARRAAIIYNPIARALSRRLHQLQRITDLLAAQGIQAKLVATAAPGSAGAQTRQEIQNGCDLIIAAGGDGTINEVAEGMLYSQVPLAILPGGTANVLARELRIPMQMQKVAGQISSLEPCRIAVGSLRERSRAPRCFLCMAGAGLDAEIVLRLNLDLKAVAGKLAYYVAGFSQVVRPIYEFDVRVDGQTYRASFALVSRVRNYGGDLEIARGASLLRDEFEIVLFEGGVSARYLYYLAGVAAGQAQRIKGCTVLRGRSVTCAPPGNREIYVQVDGELAGTLPASIELLQDALTLLVPSAYLAKERALAATPAFA
jgi:YegS/Rv2252/BmrU family lipid kinase